MKANTLKRAEPYYSQIQQTIKERIWSGFYKPGDRVFETQLSKELEISRSPVREAIRSLVNEGLLVIDSKSTITVYEPSLEDVLNIYECRRALESLAVISSAKLATDEQLNILEKILFDTQKAIKESNDEKIVKCNVEFHEEIIKISGNSMLKKLLENLQSLTYYYRSLNIQGENRASTILQGHMEIFKAIKEKNPQKAAQKFEEHTQEDLENIIKIISKSK